MSLPFTFKQFTIEQANAPMKVGTDGVLLGAWCSLSPGAQILDVGAGTGLISLMLCQRNSSSTITALEPEPDALLDLKVNFKNSRWYERLRIETCRLQDFRPSGKYDLIVSNPPFFENSLAPAHSGKTAARHTRALKPAALAAAAASLSDKGIFAGIYPVDTFERFHQEMIALGCHLNRKAFVQPTPEKEPHRILFEYSRLAQDEVNEQFTIETDRRHHYAARYIELTKDFYLGF